MFLRGVLPPFSEYNSLKSSGLPNPKDASSSLLKDIGNYLPVHMANFTEVDLLSRCTLDS
jgi:hypothetical protein